MSRETLLDFFEDIAIQPATFIVHDDGYRVREVSYAGVALAARDFSNRLETEAVKPGQKVVIWSENSVEWIVAFWGCLLARAVVVPVDYRASPQLLERIAATVEAPIILIGEDVPPPPQGPSEVWRLREVVTLPVAGATDVVAPPVEGSAAKEPRPPVTGATLAEIIFTSGATAAPKGVTITHRNILANIIPIEREVAKYKKWARPFHPIRFLNLLPLSHMFGQSMATFVPPLLAGTTIFSHGFSPVEILRQIKTRGVSVLVCVPKVLDVLRDHLERVLPYTTEPGPAWLEGRHWLWRWWHYRKVHRLFGWKFAAIVCGAAPLDPALEAYFRKLGLLIVQGYGLTETAPVVTLNHPFHASKGSVGTPIAGVEVRIAADGEILVRGDNVSAGYYVPASGGAPSSLSPAASSGDGWFHTGDIGELDSSGRLIIKGRKKEMIVTPQGLNVFPEDVERALLAQPGVIDAGVVGANVDGEERVHAVLMLEAGADVSAIVRDANATLEDHQRVWRAMVWPGAELPRTEGTRKLKRRDLQRWAAGEPGASATPPTTRSVPSLIARYAAGRALTPETTLDELGLSSLDRVELLMALEDMFQTTIDEASMTGATSVRAIEQLVASDVTSAVPLQSSVSATSLPRASAASPPPPINFPSWNRSAPAWFLRRISLPTWILPIGRLFITVEVRGLEHLDAIKGPVIFAANHQSHLDTPVIFAALPPRFRYHLAPAMAKEFFAAHFNPRSAGLKAWFLNSLNYYLACEFFNAFPLPQREAGTRQMLRYVGEVLGSGYSVLIFPEGKRTDTGEIGSFKAGIGMIGAKLDVAVVPVRLDGLDKILHAGMKLPRKGLGRVTFGPALHLQGDDYPALAKKVEAAVRRL